MCGKFWESEAVLAASLIDICRLMTRCDGIQLFTFARQFKEFSIKRTIDFSDPHHVRLKQVTFRTISQRTQTILINSRNALLSKQMRNFYGQQRPLIQSIIRTN